MERRQLTVRIKHRRLTLCTDIKGLYLSDCQFAEPAAHATDTIAAERLWKLSEQLVGEEFILGG